MAVMFGNEKPTSLCVSQKIDLIKFSFRFNYSNIILARYARKSYVPSGVRSVRLKILKCIWIGVILKKKYTYNKDSQKTAEITA